MTAGSLAAHSESGGLSDQRGLTRFGAIASADLPINLIKTPIAFQATPDRRLAYELVSLQQPESLQGGGTPWQLWFRDLPVQTLDPERGEFRRQDTVSPVAKELHSDINDPEALSRDHNFLNGYEWRLAAEAAPPLDLFGLHFYPLTLERVDIQNDQVMVVEIVGRLQLPLPGQDEKKTPHEENANPASELKDLGNAVRLRYQRQTTEGSLELSRVSLDSAVAEWPLALDANGEITDAPCSPGRPCG
ncbi:hypothetical protein XM38_019190 [Halomicronema hongdechloris C2206]|uniref:Uncharacterized protein n=1 Tax=Halomicronema hongdechloris C2206 TaxID=1641165 RepID=A0A1Z3HKZ2_9CYAN|nr:hypothetical protein [Halomicronema hongdechloris]ASC70970.1 hypothetical protein XM38_019190 [Halomicronema hongdechloris C2206]